MGKKLINFELSQEQLDREIKRIQKRTRHRAGVKNVVLTILTLAAVTVLVAALWFPVLQVTGDSMTPLLDGGQAVLTMRATEYKPGDIVAFYHNNRILIKRVMALPGDWVEIDDAGNVSVNTVKLDEPYVQNVVLEPNDLTYPCQVSDGCYFVMGDNRAMSMDSRVSEIGCIGRDRIIGKVIFRLWPIQRLEYLG